MKTIELKNRIERIESEGKKKDLNFIINSCAGIAIGVYLYYLGTVINLF